jgi:heat-inducible transcriptional repressor
MFSSQGLRLLTEAKVLSPRTDIILKSIVNWYIEKAIPVSSQNLVHDYGLRVSSATVRNEMAFLEQEGYIFRPHTSAGSVPSDKGYRYFVTSLEQTALPISEQRMISHLFHQVEGRMDEWLSLAATILARLSQNTAVITSPKPTDCQFRHVEFISLQDNLVLLVLVLRGARIKQQLLTFDQIISQNELSTIADKLNQTYVGLTASQLEAKALKSNPLEQQLTDNVLKIMKEEDEQEYNQSYLEGLHFLLNQPEFVQSRRILAIMELLEQRAMLRTIIPQETEGRDVRVVIGSENKAEIAQDCSLVIARYGLAHEASGNIVVVGPTRMAYPKVISTVSYLSMVLSSLVAELYGVNIYTNPEDNKAN